MLYFFLFFFFGEWEAGGGGDYGKGRVRYTSQNTKPLASRSRQPNEPRLWVPSNGTDELPSGSTGIICGRGSFAVLYISLG